MQDADWLEQAVQLALRSARSGGGPFGAVVVRAGELLAEGANEVTATHDPTAHAEVVAIRRACAALGDHVLDHTVVYASCEPCPMCLSAALWARVDRIVFAADRHDAARAGFSDAAFYELFGTPREAWPHLRVEQRPGPGDRRPFEAWLDDPGHHQY